MRRRRFFTSPTWRASCGIRSGPGALTFLKQFPALASARVQAALADPSEPDYFRAQQTRLFRAGKASGDLRAPPRPDQTAPDRRKFRAPGARPGRRRGPRNALFCVALFRLVRRRSPSGRQSWRGARAGSRARNRSSRRPVPAAGKRSGPARPRAMAGRVRSRWKRERVGRFRPRRQSRCGRSFLPNDMSLSEQTPSPRTARHAVGSGAARPRDPSHPRMARRPTASAVTRPAPSPAR